MSGPSNAAPAERDPWDVTPAADRRFDLRGLAEMLWRHKWTPVLCLAIAMVLGQIYLRQLDPAYTARAEILLDREGERVVNLQSVTSELGWNPAPNQVRILTSQKLLGRAVTQLRLDRDAEFNPALAPPSVLAGWQATVRDALSQGALAGWFSAPSEPPSDLEEVASANRLGVIAQVRARLAVQAVPGSDVIGISFTSTDPGKAALVANTLADLYIVDQLETKFEATRRASSWLSGRLDALKSRVEASEAQVQAYKARWSIIEVDGDGNINLQQLADLNTELITARAARAESEARYQQVRRRIGAGGLGAAADVVSSPMVLTLRTQLSELARREAELATRYGPKHPNIINVRAEISDVRAAVTAEVRKIVEQLENDVAVARARQRTLESGVSELEAKSAALSKSAVQLRQLEREAAAERTIYENFLNRFRQTSEQEDLETPDARVLSEATAPLTPSAPSRRKIMALSGAAGLTLGLGLIALMETLANTFRAAAEVTSRTGLPVLAALPRVAKAGRARRKLLDHLRDKPNTALAESVRKLRTALFLSNIDEPPRVVAMTSSVPGEGKSTAALMLAHMSLQMNKSAIVVDCDIRRPVLHKTMGISEGQGLLDILEGSANLDTAVHVDPESGLHVLPTLEAIPQAADVLSSARFRQLVDRLRERYDLVILDTPPVLLVSDALVIGRNADAMVYAIRWDHTPIEGAAQGIRMVQEMGLRIAGAIVTLVDRRVEARYAAAQYGYGSYTGKDGYYVE